MLFALAGCRKHSVIRQSDRRSNRPIRQLRVSAIFATKMGLSNRFRDIPDRALVQVDVG